jgi:hypothetical protein
MQILEPISLTYREGAKTMHRLRLALKCLELDYLSLLCKWILNTATHH